MKFKKSLYALAIAGACSVSVSAATLTFDLTEVSGGVNINISGSLTASLWSFHSSSSVGPGNLFMRSQVGVSYSIFSYNISGSRDNYAPVAGVSVVGPASFGTSSTSQSFAVSNATGAVNGGFRLGTSPNTFDYLYTPGGYNFGTGSLAGTGTFAGQTFSSMSLTPGSYSWVLTGSGALTGVSDTITLNVGTASPVPEASGSVAGLGLAVAGLYQLGRRRRNTVSQ